MHYHLSAALIVLLFIGCQREESSSGAAAVEPAADKQAGQADPGSSTRPTAGSSNPARPSTLPSAKSEGGHPEHSRLYGTWEAENVDVKAFGDARIRLTFREDGPVKILAWSEIPLVGQVRDKTASYQIRDHTLVSDALRGGTEVGYRFTDDGKLVIEYKDGKTVKFKRLSGQTTGY